MCALALLLIMSIVRVAPPWVIRTGVNDAVSGSGGTLWHFAGLGGLFLLLHLVNAFVSYLQMLITRRVEAGVIRDLRNDVFRHLQTLSLKFYDNRETGELMSRVLNDVSRLEMGLVQGFVSVIRDSAVFAWLTALLFYLNWQLAILALAVVPIMAVATYVFNIRAHRVWRRIREKMAHISVAVNENLVGSRVVKIFAREEQAIADFEDHTNESYTLNLRAASMMAAFTQVVSVLNAAGLALVLAYGGYLVLRGTIQAGDLVALLMYVGMLYAPINGLVRANYHIQRAAVAGERVFDLLDTRPEIEDAPDAVDLPRVSGRVEFQGVSFTYDKDPVLRDISLVVEPGEVAAIVGPSGAGKTTLVQLLLRLYEPTAGRLLVDGHDVRAVTAASLRDQITMVTQDIFLFSGTIRENIAYSRPDASEEEILAASKAAHVHEFAARFADGYETLVGERGVKLSEGQKQRVAIARALLKDAAILILDEPTSSVDTESERLIQESLDHLMKARTTFVIAHRLTTVIGADKIVVLDDGRVLDTGTHEELLERNELYNKLYSVQFNYEAFKDQAAWSERF